MNEASPSSPPSKFELDMFALDHESNAGDNSASSDDEEKKFFLRTSGATMDIVAYSHRSADVDDDDFLPALMESSSSSSGISTIVADSWEQFDAVAEKPSLWSAPLFWFCAPLDFLPSCRADHSRTTASNECSSFRIAQRDTDFKQAFQASDVFPFIGKACGIVQKGDTTPEEWTRRWNGYLPLDPVPDFYYRYPCLRERRRHRIPAVVDHHSCDSYDPETSLFAPSLSIEEPEEITTTSVNFVLVCIVV